MAGDMNQAGVPAVLAEPFSGGLFSDKHSARSKNIANGFNFLANVRGPDVGNTNHQRNAAAVFGVGDARLKDRCAGRITNLVIIDQKMLAIEQRMERQVMHETMRHKNNGLLAAKEACNR